VRPRRIRGNGRLVVSEQRKRPTRRSVTADCQILLLWPAQLYSLFRTVCGPGLQSPQARIADSSSMKAVSFSSACTTKRFPSPRWTSANPDLFAHWNQSLRHSHQLQPAFLRLSAIISQYFTARDCASFPLRAAMSLA
jgi:hypothetical protein